MSDSEGRTLTFVPPPRAAEEGSGSIETGLADVVTFQRRRQARMSAQDEEGFFVDALAEYQWARDSAELAPSTIDQLIKPVIEVCDFYGTVPWHLTPRDVDKYFAGPGKRAQHAPAEAQPHRRVLRLPRTALRPRDHDAVRRDGGVTGRPVQQVCPPWGLRAADPTLTDGDEGVLRPLAGAVAVRPEVRRGLPRLRHDEDRVPLRSTGCRAVLGDDRRHPLGTRPVGPVRRPGQGRSRLGTTAPRGLHVPRGTRAALVVHRGGPGGVRRRR